MFELPKQEQGILGELWLAFFRIKKLDHTLRLAEQPQLDLTEKQLGLAILPHRHVDVLKSFRMLHSERMQRLRTSFELVSF